MMFFDFLTKKNKKEKRFLRERIKRGDRIGKKVSFLTKLTILKPFSLICLNLNGNLLKRVKKRLELIPKI